MLARDLACVLPVLVFMALLEWCESKRDKALYCGGKFRKGFS